MKTYQDFISEMKDDLPAIEAEIMSFFRKGTSTVRKEDHSNEGKNAVACISSRYWGDWEMPDGEDDDGDYDWEVLTDKSAKILKDFVASLSKKHKNYTFRLDPSEKNWITITVLKK